MSLIDEALKRARQEAAQQDAARRGAAPSWTPVPLARLHERRSLVPPLALALLLAIGMGAWLTRSWWMGRAPTPPKPAAVVTTTQTPGPAERSVALPAAPTPRPLTPAPRDAVRSAPGPGGERANRGDRASRGERSDRDQAAPEPRPDVRTYRVEPPSAPRPEPRREAVPASSAPAPIARPAAAEPTTAPRARIEDARPAQTAPAPIAVPEPSRSYVREAALPGGRKLELRGIAFSDTQPVVLINGKVLSPGEGVEGYTVVSIQPQRVELKGASGTLYLTLQ